MCFQQFLRATKLKFSTLEDQKQFFKFPPSPLPNISRRSVQYNRNDCDVSLALPPPPISLTDSGSRLTSNTTHFSCLITSCSRGVCSYPFLATPYSMQPMYEAFQQFPMCLLVGRRKILLNKIPSWGDEHAFVHLTLYHASLLDKKEEKK